MRNKIFFAGIPENELSDHSRKIIEQELRGQEVQFVPETNPKEFIKAHGYKDDNGRPSVAGYTVHVVGNVETEESTLWNRLLNNPATKINVIFAEDILFDSVSDTQIAGWVETGKVPAPEESSSEDDFDFLFSGSSDDSEEISEPEEIQKEEDPSDQMIEIKDTPADTSSLSQNPLSMGNQNRAPVSIPSSLQQEMGDSNDSDDEEIQPPTNRINGGDQRNQEVRQNNELNDEQNLPDSPMILPPFMNQDQPEEPRRREREVVSQDYVSDSYSDDQSNYRQDRNHGSQNESRFHTEPETDRFQNSDYQRFNEPARQEFVDPRQQYPSNQGYQDQEPTRRTRRRAQEEEYGNFNSPRGYGNSQESVREEHRFENPIYRTEDDFREQPRNNGFAQQAHQGYHQDFNDNQLNDEILGGNNFYDGGDNRRNRSGRNSGFQNIDHSQEYDAPYLQRLEPEQQRRQVDRVSRFEASNGPVSQVSQHNSSLPKNKILMITSSRGGGGKTSLSFTAANALSMGLNACGDDRKVWLIEADYENPKLEERFDRQGNNINVIARALQENQKSSSGGSGRNTVQQIIGNYLDRAYVRPDGAPSNLMVIPAQYDLVGTEKVEAKWIMYALTETIKYIRDHLGGYIVIDNGTLTASHLNPLHQSLATIASKNVIVAWPDNHEDALRSAEIVTSSGVEVANTKIFLNKVTDNDEFFRIQDIMKPYQVAGSWPVMPSIDKKWIGSDLVTDEDRTALLQRTLLFLDYIGFRYETQEIIQAYNHVNDGQPNKGLMHKIRKLTGIFSK